MTDNDRKQIEERLHHVVQAMDQASEPNDFFDIIFLQVIREDVPALLDEVARLTAENKGLRGRVGNLEHVAAIADDLSHESDLGYSYKARELRAALRAVGMDTHA